MTTHPEVPQEQEYVYGWGSRKHIPAPGQADVVGRPVGLCGAFGGHAAAPGRKTCVKCLKLAGQKPCSHCDGTGIES